MDIHICVYGPKSSTAVVSISQGQNLQKTYFKIGAVVFILKLGNLACMGFFDVPNQMRNSAKLRNDPKVLKMAAITQDGRRFQKTITMNALNPRHYFTLFY